MFLNFAFKKKFLNFNIRLNPAHELSYQSNTPLHVFPAPPPRSFLFLSLCWLYSLIKIYKN